MTERLARSCSQSVGFALNFLRTLSRVLDLFPELLRMTLHDASRHHRITAAATSPGIRRFPRRRRQLRVRLEFLLHRGAAGCSSRDEDDPKMMQPKLSHPSRRETYSISRWLSARARCHAPKGLVSDSSRRAPVCLDCSHLHESAGRDYRALLHRRVRRGLPSFPNLATRFFHGFYFPSKTLNRPLVSSLSRDAQSRCASRGATLRGESHTSRPRLSGDFVARVAEAS